MTTLTNSLSELLANTYALYLKTQNYHWHVRGPYFKTLHDLFEEQYRELAEVIDEIAESIVMRGSHAPATFIALEKLKTLKDSDYHSEHSAMVKELHLDHGQLIAQLEAILPIAQAANDEAIITLLSDRISAHKKMYWMLGASQ